MKMIWSLSSIVVTTYYSHVLFLCLATDVTVSWIAVCDYWPINTTDAGDETEFIKLGFFSILDILPYVSTRTNWCYILWCDTDASTNRHHRSICIMLITANSA